MDVGDGFGKKRGGPVGWDGDDGMDCFCSTCSSLARTCKSDVRGGKSDGRRSCYLDGSWFGKGWVKREELWLGLKGDDVGQLVCLVGAEADSGRYIDCGRGHEEHDAANVRRPVERVPYRRRVKLMGWL